MGSVFLITLPLVLVALVLARVCVPGHTNEATDPVDHLGGILSVLGIALLVLAISFASVPGDKPFTVVVGALALIDGGLLPAPVPRTSTADLLAHYAAEDATHAAPARGQEARSGGFQSTA